MIVQVSKTDPFYRGKKQVAEILEEIAALLQIKGENPFKSRAYTNAARAIRTTQEDLTELVTAGRLQEIKGIGGALEEKIAEIVTTGQCKYHQELRAPYPPGFMEMLKIPGLGTGKMRVLWEKLGISTIGELEYACNENRLALLEGFGEKTQQKILKGIDYIKRHRGQYLSNFALREATALLESLGESPDARQVSLAGSLRRRNEIVKDIDIIASSPDPRALVTHFVALPQIEAIVEQDETRATVTLISGINSDLQVVSEKEFPYALRYFTGSKEHNAALRRRAENMGLKLDERGLFRGDDLVACRDEEELLARLGLADIPPELREDMGEIEAAEKDSLPRLVTEDELQGILHVHSTYSDGTGTLEEMIVAAVRLGYKYIGISDHSKSAFYASGLNESDIARQQEEIAGIQKRFPQIRIFKGIESDILADGSLDYDRSTLAGFDFVIGSIHSRFNMTEQEMTARVIRAIENPFLTVLGHPTGRLLLSRDSYPLDVRKVIDAAAANHAALEINAHPHRLELDWRFGRYAAEKGATLSVNPDAHNPAALSDVNYGIGIARKSWLGCAQILNCRDAEGFLQFSLSRR
jgi:DNA polymerase (family 10)